MPLYLTIGNLLACICNSPNSLALVPIAFLPVFPKKREEKTQERYYHGMQVVFERILEKFKPGSIQGIEILCSDNRSRICHPIACVWLADHPEKMSFLELSINACSYCEVPPDCLGEYKAEHPTWNYFKYRQIIRDGNLGKPTLDEKERDQGMK